MWNKPYFGNESELVSWAIKALGERLPPDWRVEGPRREVRRGNLVLDAVVRVVSPDGKAADVVMETKSRLDPVDVPAIVDRVIRSARGEPALLVSSFLSPRTRERLKQEKVSFADTTGNMWLVLQKPGLFVETTGADRDPQPTTRVLASLKGRAAGRVVRALCDYKPPYGIRELAERSKTALASVARVVALLERDAIVVRNKSKAVTDADPDALIRRWTQDYSLLKSNSARSFLEPRDLKGLLGRLAKFRAKYAVTGSLAAGIRTAAFPGRLAVVYVDEIDAAASFLGLRPAETGANVFLIRPFDPVVYERGSKSGDVSFAAPSQVAADLLTSPGRGPADGEDLLAWMKGNPDAWRV